MARNYWGDALPDYVDLPKAAPAERPGYGRIDFEKLPNTRDLGGMTGADGRRVKPGHLLRSGTLGFGTAGDIARLRDEYRLKFVCDFRNGIELSELPDPMGELPDARYLHAEIFAENQVGITQEQGPGELERKLRELVGSDPMAFMEKLYPYMLLGEAGIEGYRAFLRGVMAVEDGSALWHCYVGRDRCGMGSALVETMLGVSREDMVNDYLATNLYAPLQLTLEAPAALRFFEAVERALEPMGGFMGYITETLDVTDEEIAAFRKRHLED